MFKNAPNIVKWIGYLLITALTLSSVGYVTMFWIRNQESRFVEVVEMPYTKNAQGQPTHFLKAGEGIILHWTTERKDIGCFADYVHTLVGQVHFQYPARKAFVFPPMGASSNITLETFFEIPKDMPKGVYEWNISVYPNCNGFNLPPYNLTPKASFTIQ